MSSRQRYVGQVDTREQQQKGNHPQENVQWPCELTAKKGDPAPGRLHLDAAREEGIMFQRAIGSRRRTNRWPHALEERLCRCWIDAITEPPDHDIAFILAIPESFTVEWNRRVGGVLANQTGKEFWVNADNRVRLAVDQHCFPDNSRVSMVTLSPIPVGDDRNARRFKAPGTNILASDKSAQRRADAQSPVIIACDPVD